MYLQLGCLPTTTMRHWTPTLNPLFSAKLDVLAVYLLYYSVCDVQVQSSGDSSEHGQVLTEDWNNFEFEEFFPLRGTNGLSAHNLVKGLYSILLANDVPVDILPLIPWNLLSVLNNLFFHVRHALHNRFHTLVPRSRFPLQWQCVYLRFLSN
jgi:hypothetical protein